VTDMLSALWFNNLLHWTFCRESLSFADYTSPGFILENMPVIQNDELSITNWSRQFFFK